MVKKILRYDFESVKNVYITVFQDYLIGASRPDGIPYGFADIFFFVLFCFVF